jgi:hypothetical protein
MWLFTAQAIEWPPAHPKGGQKTSQDGREGSRLDDGQEDRRNVGPLTSEGSSGYFLPSVGHGPQDRAVSFGRPGCHEIAGLFRCASPPFIFQGQIILARYAPDIQP